MSTYAPDHAKRLLVEEIMHLGVPPLWRSAVDYRRWLESGNLTGLAQLRDQILDSTQPEKQKP